MHATASANMPPQKCEINECSWKKVAFSVCFLKNSYEPKYKNAAGAPPTIVIGRPR